MIRRLGPIVLLLAFVTSGCSSDDSSSPTSPTVVATTETLSGTVDVGGSAVHQFTVALSGGQVNVTLTAAGPPSTIYMGIGIGTYSSDTCTLLSGASVVTQAGSTAQLTGTVNAGSYCLKVFDAGNQTASITYAVTLTHF